jgi:hypothetical protein
MIGFTNEHRERFRIRLEQGAVRTDPYGHYIPGSRGHIYVHGPDLFGVATIGRRPKLRSMPWLTIAQDGDDGFNATFPVERLKTIARMIGAYRRPRLSPEQRAAMAERMRKTRLLASRNASDEKDDQRHHPDRADANLRPESALYRGDFGTKANT